jgi:hypothetical protein
MRNINDFNSKVFELVILQKRIHTSVNESEHGSMGALCNIQSLLTWFWKSSSSSDFVKKYLTARHAVAAIAITIRTTIFERFTALVSALAMLILESLLTPPVWLVSVPEDREADSDDWD